MSEVPLSALNNERCARFPRIEVLEGETAMHLAARSVSESALWHLVELGADLSKTNLPLRQTVPPPPPPLPAFHAHA